MEAKLVSNQLMTIVRMYNITKPFLTLPEATRWLKSNGYHLVIHSSDNKNNIEQIWEPDNISTEE